MRLQYHVILFAEPLSVYNKLVFVSHSMNLVISLDLLHYETLQPVVLKPIHYTKGFTTQ